MSDVNTLHSRTFQFLPPLLSKRAINMEIRTARADVAAFATNTPGPGLHAARYRGQRIASLMRNVPGSKSEDKYQVIKGRKQIQPLIIVTFLVGNPDKTNMGPRALQANLLSVNCAF